MLRCSVTWGSMQFNIKHEMVQDTDQLISNIRDRLDRPIVLVGMMGVGKSKLGRMLAKALDLSFHDSDAEVEVSAGCSVSEIFDRYGEAAFAQAEAKIINRLIGQGVSVIATGGGSMMLENAADLIWARTLSLWVRADLDLMVDRTARRGKLPQLGSDQTRRAFLSELMTERYPVYGRASGVVNSHDGPATETLYQALRVLDSCLDNGRSPVA